MGSICCPDSKKDIGWTPPYLTPLRNGTILFAAQLMKTTKNGKPVNLKTMRTAPSEAEVSKMRNDPTLSSDMKIILSPPFIHCSKLTNYVYLSGMGSITKENLEKLQINLIINATYEWPKICPTFRGKEVVNIRVPVDDSGQDDISIYFDEVADKIEENAEKGGHTLVHCMAGASRSTTIVLAYLMKHENISLLKAFKSVKKRRETGRPNFGFWEQLIKYEIRIRGKSSTKMVTENVEGVLCSYPEFYKTTFPDLLQWELNKQLKEGREKIKNPALKTKGEKVYNNETMNYE